MQEPDGLWFPSPREDFRGSNEGKTVVTYIYREFPSPREDFGGSNERIAKSKANNHQFPSPRED